MKITRIEEHPEFTARDKHSVWIFKLDLNNIPIEFNRHNFAGNGFASCRMENYHPERYAWNGCSPKFSILDTWIAGTPDGYIDIETGKPKTYTITGHDALYQYFDGMISPEDYNRLFTR